MKKIRINLKRILRIAGVLALIVGIADPLEGSVIIAAGSVLLTISTYLSKDPKRKLFLISSALIITGIFFMFYFSSLGGFGGSSSLSWWWGVLILPYPVGWLISIVLLINKAVQRLKTAH